MTTKSFSVTLPTELVDQFRSLCTTRKVTQRSAIQMAFENAVKVLTDMPVAGDGAGRRRLGDDVVRIPVKGLASPLPTVAAPVVPETLTAPRKTAARKPAKPTATKPATPAPVPDPLADAPAVAAPVEKPTPCPTPLDNVRATMIRSVAWLPLQQLLDAYAVSREDLLEGLVIDDDVRLIEGEEHVDGLGIRLIQDLSLLDYDTLSHLNALVKLKVAEASQETAHAHA